MNIYSDNSIKKKGKQKRNIRNVPGFPAQIELCSQRIHGERKKDKNFTDTPCFKGEKR